MEDDLRALEQAQPPLQRRHSGGARLLVAPPALQQRDGGRNSVLGPLDSSLLLHVRGMLDRATLGALRLVSKATRDCLDSARKAIDLDVQRLQQDLADERIVQLRWGADPRPVSTADGDGPGLVPDVAAAGVLGPSCRPTPPPPQQQEPHQQRPYCAFFRALDRWPALEAVELPGPVPSACMVQLVHAALADGRTAQLRALLAKLRLMRLAKVPQLRATAHAAQAAEAQRFQRAAAAGMAPSSAAAGDDGFDDGVRGETSLLISDYGRLALASSCPTDAIDAGGGAAASGSGVAPPAPDDPLLGWEPLPELIDSEDEREQNLAHADAAAEAAAAGLAPPALPPLLLPHFGLGAHGGPPPLLDDDGGSSDEGDANDDEMDVDGGPFGGGAAALQPHGAAPNWAGLQQLQQILQQIQHMDPGGGDLPQDLANAVLDLPGVAGDGGWAWPGPLPPLPVAPEPAFGAAVRGGGSVSGPMQCDDIAVALAAQVKREGCAHRARVTGVQALRGAPALSCAVRFTCSNNSPRGGGGSACVSRPLGCGSCQDRQPAHAQLLGTCRAGYDEAYAGACPPCQPTQVAAH